MDLDEQFRSVIRNTKILKSPNHRLATFGQTKIDYFFLSEVAGFPDRSRMRRGQVVAAKPQIITPESMKETYEGFGRDAAAFGRWLGNLYGEQLQGLQYQFRNESNSVHIEYSPLRTLADEVIKRLSPEEERHTAVIEGPDPAWRISLLKFIVDESLASFAGNVRELDEHGFFDDPDKLARQRKKEIEGLFSAAVLDRRAIPTLGQKLHTYGVFKDYEERFFQLLKH